MMSKCLQLSSQYEEPNHPGPGFQRDLQGIVDIQSRQQAALGA